MQTTGQRASNTHSNSVETHPTSPAPAPQAGSNDGQRATQKSRPLVEAGLFVLLNMIGWATGLDHAATFNWAFGVSNTTKGVVEVNEPSIALAGALAGALSVLGLPKSLRQGRGWLWWLLATVPVWLLCARELATINQYTFSFQSTYDNAVGGPFLLALVAQGVLQSLVLAKRHVIGLFWLVIPVASMCFALVAAFIAACGVNIVLMVGQINVQPWLLEKLVFLLGTGWLYGLLTAVALQALSAVATLVQSE